MDGEILFVVEFQIVAPRHIVSRGKASFHNSGKQASSKVTEKTPLLTLEADNQTSPTVADSVTSKAALKNSPTVLEKSSSIEGEHANPINSLAIMQITSITTILVP